MRAPFPEYMRAVPALGCVRPKALNKTKNIVLVRFFNYSVFDVLYSTIKWIKRLYGI